VVEGPLVGAASRQSNDYHLENLGHCERERIIRTNSSFRGL
jgi:hypothetical protein